MDEHDRVQYRRRKEEDRWVANYCPFLLCAWGAHIHTDVVTSTSVFFYLYKYLYKGQSLAFSRS